MSKTRRKTGPGGDAWTKGLLKKNLQGAFTPLPHGINPPPAPTEPKNESLGPKPAPQGRAQLPPRGPAPPSGTQLPPHPRTAQVELSVSDGVGVLRRLLDQLRRELHHPSEPSLGHSRPRQAEPSRARPAPPSPAAHSRAGAARPPAPPPRNGGRGGRGREGRCSALGSVPSPEQ